jgi:iron complex transport system substrate-binding protein
MKRFNLLLVIFGLMSLLLAACGDSPTATSVPTTTAASTSTTIASALSTTASNVTGQFPVSVVDGSGTTITVSKKVEKVFCTVIECFDILLELGLQPVAVSKAAFDFGQTHWFKPEFFGNLREKLPVVNYSTSGPNLEDLAKVKPDLVMTGNNVGDLREGLKNIAPLYIQKGGAGSYTALFDNLRAVGKLTGREAQAEAAIGRFQDKLAAYKAKSPRNRTALLIWGYSLPPLVATNKTSQGVLISELTKYPWEFLQGGDSFGSAPYSVERILEVDPDVIFIRVNDANFASTSALKTEKESYDLFFSNPVLKELKAAKNGKVYPVVGYQMSGGTISLGEMLDAIMPKIYPEVFPKGLP